MSISCFSNLQSGLAQHMLTSTWQKAPKHRKCDEFKGGFRVHIWWKTWGSEPAKCWKMQDCPSAQIPCWPLVRTSWRCSVCASSYNVRVCVVLVIDGLSKAPCASEQPMELFQCDFWGANVNPNREKDCSYSCFHPKVVVSFFFQRSPQLFHNHVFMILRMIRWPWRGKSNF